MVTSQTAAELTVAGRYGTDGARLFREQGWWRDGSAAALLDYWAREQPGQRFVSDGTTELSYAGLRGMAYRLAARLLARGVRRGDRVVVQLPNWAEFAVAYLAVSRIGAVLVPVMMVHRHAEVRHILQNSGAVAVITTGRFRSFDHAAMFRALRAECPAVASLLLARAQPEDGELAFEEACGPAAGAGGGAVPDDRELGPYPDPDLPHVIVYTSGTESTAKGCVHTWNTIDFSARGLATDVFELTPGDVMFMPSPVAHATGLLVGILLPLVAGAQTHLLDIWDPAEALRRIGQYRCTATATATPFVRMALDAAPGHRTDLSCMRFWLCAGAPIPAALAHEFAGVFTGGRLVPLYGCSEVMAATCCHPGDPLERRSGSDGTPALPGIRIRITGPDGARLAPGQEGEICYWGPGSILGYWRDPERTAAAIDPGGWYHTGDLGRADQDGYVRVTGRLKDIIIRGGSNISAGEVEGHLLAHPAVAAAAVVGYPDDRLGERACAIVVPAPGTAPTLADLADFLRSQRGISPHKIPERLVLAEALPVTATGKVQKFLLRDLARDGG